MLIALPLAVGLVAALALRHAEGPGGRRPVLAVAALALGIRLVAALAVYLVARQAHDTGVWLSDEASFFLATQSLLPDPLNRALPVGLDHLGGDGYLGLTTVISLAGGGVADANALRVMNAALGSAVVVFSMLVARRLFGARAGLVAGLVLAVWPTLVLWSATMLRDTLGSFALVVVWWTLGRARHLGWVRTVGAVLLALVIVFSLRPYAGVALAVGVVAWAVYPLLRRQSKRNLAIVGAAAALVAIAAVPGQLRHIDYATHNLFYHQTLTRLETIGRLYTDEPPDAENLPIKPGTPVAIVDPHTGWAIGGVVQDFDAADVVRLALADETIRDVPMDQVMPIQSVAIPPAQFAASILRGVGSYLLGSSTTSETSSEIWVADAIVSDILLVLAAVGAVRWRLSPLEWLLPLCVVGGTTLALVAVPGAPGNADRHRTTQTFPLIVVLASGLLAMAPTASARRRRSRRSLAGEGAW